MVASTSDGEAAHGERRRSPDREQAERNQEAHPAKRTMSGQHDDEVRAQRAVMAAGGSGSGLLNRGKARLPQVLADGYPTRPAQTGSTRAASTMPPGQPGGSREGTSSATAVRKQAPRRTSIPSALECGLTPSRDLHN